MLTVVHSLAGSWVFIGGSSAANERSALKYGDSESGVDQGAAGGESGNASTYDSDCRLLFVLVIQSYAEQTCIRPRSGGCS